MNEIWKPIEGTNGVYEVSNTGKVRSLDYKRTGQIAEISTRKNNRGYVIVSLSINGKAKTALLHRLVASAFIPNPNGLPQVNHIDGVKENCSVDNLEWCDASYNMRHASEHGLLENVKRAARENIHRLDEHREQQKIRVVSINMRTKDFKVHDSILGAVNDLGIPSTKEIVTILKKGWGTSKGFTFVRLDDFDPNNIEDIIQHTEKEKTRSRREGAVKSTKEIIATRISDMEEIEFASIADASRALGVFASNISAILSGKGKSAKGYTFRFSGR